jgi:hypothetical protein
MDLVMFHSGGTLPAFLECNFKQIRLFNPDINVFFLTDSGLMNDPLFEKYEVKALNKDNYYSDKIRQFEFVFTYDRNDLWFLAAVRLFYIENFLKSQGLTDVYHFENDVLLYYDLSEHHSKFQRLYQNIAITPGGPDKSMTGFMFIRYSESLARMTQFFISVLHIYGMQGIIDAYHMDMLNEMTLMKAYHLDFGDKYITDLPILPFGEHSENYSEFHSVFDPASWGQFVGGTQTWGPGATPPDHYIGQLLMAHPEYTVTWYRDEQGRNIPYFKYDDVEVKINNLHIHSKNLHLYIS